MATLKVNQIQDTSSNQYGFKNGTIIQVRNYMYTDTHVRSGNSEERMPNILGNGLAVITTHSNKNHIMQFLDQQTIEFSFVNLVRLYNQRG
jgi:hypothetical protein